MRSDSEIYKELNRIKKNDIIRGNERQDSEYDKFILEVLLDIRWLLDNQRAIDNNGGIYDGYTQC